MTIGFVGEFLSLAGFYRINWVMALLAGTGIILGAVYMLVLYKIIFGAVVHAENKTLKDLNVRKSLQRLFLLLPLLPFWVFITKPITGNAIDMSVKNACFNGTKSG